MRRIPLPVVVPVRGVSFHQDLVRTIAVGQPLEVVADPGNEFDANACAVRVGGEILGHLPREIACRLRSEGHLCWSAEVVEVLHGSKATGLRIKLLSPVAHAQPVPSLAVENPAAPPAGLKDHAAEKDAVTVSARSGRRLGRLLERTDDTVRVLTDDERIVAYPESLVVLSD